MMERRGRGRGPRPATRGDGPLAERLRRIDGGPWAQYKQIVGEHEVGEFRLLVDHVPPDPFAGAARVRLVATRDPRRVPEAWSAGRNARVAAEDTIARDAAEALRRLDTGGRTGPGRGSVSMQSLGPGVVERSAVRLKQDRIELRLHVDLPAAGRRVRGLQAATLLTEELPRFALAALTFSRERCARVEAALRRTADHAEMQRQLRERGLVAFLADGALLPRASGVDSGPRRDGLEQPLAVPDALAFTLEDAAGQPVRGLGIPAGVTVIVGGAFHGKTTLLESIAHGVAPKRDGDGRERVVTVGDAVTVRAEDGRSVRQVDLGGFFERLPSGVDVRRFDTEKASGSTSQAAGLVEALELGTSLLLIDEDKAATNFMIRDGRMQQLVPRPAESVIPFIDRVRALYDQQGISTVLVTGGSGDYLEVADSVIQMEAYQPRDRTADARRIARESAGGRVTESLAPWHPPQPREVLPLGKGEHWKMGTRGDDVLRIGRDHVDIQALDQRSESGQALALAAILRRVGEQLERPTALVDLVAEIDAWLDQHGLDGLQRPAAYELSRPRPSDIAGALNRWRRLVLRPVQAG